MRWDDLMSSVNPNSATNGPDWDGNWRAAGSPSNVNLGGLGSAQAYTYETSQRPGSGPDSPYGTATVFNVLDGDNAPEGYNTQLYRKDDGSVGVRYYEEKNGFLKDMSALIAGAGLLGAGISAIGGNAAGAGGGAGASSGGGSLGGGMAGSGVEALPAGGMGATGTSAPWVGAGEATLGSGLTSVGVPGLSTELLGTGLAGSITPAAAIPGMTYGLGGSIMAGAPGTLSTAEGIGSAVTNFVNTGAGLTPLIPGTTLPPISPGTPTPPGGTPPGSAPPTTTVPGGTPPPTTPPVVPPGIGSTIGDILTNPLTSTVAGAVLGGANGSQQSGSTTTAVEPWSGQKPYLLDLYANAQGLFNANRNPSAAETNALNAIQQRAAAGSPLQTAATSNIQDLLGQDPTQAYGIGQANQYLGQTVDPISNQYLGQTTPKTNNQYIGRTASVGANPMLGLNNPYIESAINSAQEDVIRAMQPQFAAAQRASGSFGNSGLQETYARELPRALGNISNSMRMADYGTQQQLQEAAVNRALQSQQTDLARNSSLAQGQEQFNAGLTQGDLARNASLASSLGQFNAGLQQSDLARNSGLAQQGIQNNIGQYNNMLGLQTDAAYRAPGLAAADYNDAQMAYNTAFGARQNAFMPLQQYQGAISGNPGSSTSSPYFTNPAANILGGATAGLGLWNAAKNSGLTLGGGNSFGNWINSNQGVMNSTGLGWSDLLSGF
jgi:hypothetical protein